VLELAARVSELAANNPFLECEPAPLGEVWPNSVRPSESRAEPVVDPLARVGVPWTLADEVSQQLRLSGSPAEHVSCALWLVGCLDENGYLPQDIEAAALAQGYTKATFTAALSLLQSCEPRGVGARDLRECLLLQVDLVPPAQQSLVRVLIDHYLADVAAGRWKTLARRLGVPLHQVQAALAAMRRLQPRPGGGFSAAGPVYVVPDAWVEFQGGRWSVVLHERALPRLRLRTEYRVLLQQVQDPGMQASLVQQWRAAHGLLRGLAQRRHTLLRVMTALVEMQQAFFCNGWDGLQPLTMQDLAAHLGLHVSTVSRVVRDKWLATPYGVMPLRDLFSAAVPTQHGAAAVRVVKVALAHLVAQEDAAKPWSDAELAQRLLASGVQVSRRTVAKYREQLGIPASWQRRQAAVSQTFGACGGDDSSCDRTRV
ncbi:MAG: RNA polymerase factor sigma-54, partial [Alicyclobacillus sp.]|nr:RNA polymerase factor sigma-54 [Alicyclobacillus sp.]